MLSLFKSTLLVSFALVALQLQVISAAPQDPAAGFGGDGGYGGLEGHGGNPTEIPVGPVTIAAQTDFVPLNNILPIVNVYPPNINDYSWDPYYDPYYGGLGGLGDNDVLGGLGASAGLGGISALGGLGGLGALGGLGGLGAPGAQAGLGGLRGVRGVGEFGPMGGINVDGLENIVGPGGLVL
ncbi:hypothetical protein BGX33_002177 [Mortierella sp. NVP41]|nr:hypothetical protein BGX33_002177 [Mortierella sp. NVP41]